MILLKLFEIRSIQNHLMWVTEPGVTCQLHITDLLLSSLNILNMLILYLTPISSVTVSFSDHPLAPQECSCLAAAAW